MHRNFGYFMNLVSLARVEQNPTVKTEIKQKINSFEVSDIEQDLNKFLPIDQRQIIKRLPELTSELF